MDNNGWPGKLGVPLTPDQEGWHWVQRVDKGFVPSPRIILWTDDWTSRQFSWDAIGYEADERRLGRDFRYLGPCLTPAEVDARVQQARRQALLDAHQRALLYANTSYQHGHLPVNPHECAAQVAMEIASSISGIDPDIRKAGYAFSRKVLEAAAQKAERIIVTEGPWSNIPRAIRALKGEGDE